MRTKLAILIAFIITTCLTIVCSAADPSDPNRYLNAVREFADNVLEYGRDTTNATIGKHTLKVEIPPVPGEQNTEDNVKTATIEVTEPDR